MRSGQDGSPPISTEWRRRAQDPQSGLCVKALYRSACRHDEVLAQLDQMHGKNEIGLARLMENVGNLVASVRAHENRIYGLEAN